MEKAIFKKSLSIILIFMLAFSFTALASESTNNGGENTLSVSGTHKIKVAPDIAYITIGVATFNEDAKIAQEENKTKMNAVMEELKKLGIEDKYIKTINYNISPRYEWNDIKRENISGTVESQRERILVGYDVNNRIRITITDLEKTGSIIDLTVKEGINEANSIYFDLSDEKRDETYLEALKGAVENAHKKAETMASVFNIKLDMPLSIIESGSYIPAPIQSRNSMSIAKDESAGYGMSPTPISEGEMEITANVNLVYEY